MRRRVTTSYAENCAHAHRFALHKSRPPSPRDHRALCRIETALATTSSRTGDLPTKARRLEVIPKLLEHLATVADFVLLLRRQVGHRASQLRKVEDRIIAEAAGARRRVGDP